MKLLIIAGPYEADRIRRAAVSAGFETVAVEPGESLSGWITASRPDLIVMAPQIVSTDPAVAMAKVRSVPRGRVPIFLVGDSGDEARLRELGADGFFVRPVSTADLVARARARLEAPGGGGTGGTGTGTGLGAGGGSGLGSGIGTGAGLAASPATGAGTDGGLGRRTNTGEHAAVPLPVADAASGEVSGRSSGGKSGAHTPLGAGGKAPFSLKPLVAAADASGPVPVPKARPSEAGALFVKLAESIDATLDAEMHDFARSVGALRSHVPTLVEPKGALASRARAPERAEEELERTPMAPMTALAAAAALPHVDPTYAGAPGGTTLVAPSELEGADDELRDDVSQRTVKVPNDVFARMVAERAVSRGPFGAPGGPAPVESGKLGDTDVAALIGRVVIERLTGRLALRRAGIEKLVYFDRGLPTIASSSDESDRMGEMMVRQGRLSDAQQAQGVEALAKSGRRFGSTLARLGVIKVSELPPLVRRHYEEIVHSVFAWEDGEWALGPERPPRDENVMLTEHPAALILEGIRRKYGSSRLRRCLGGGGQVFRLPAAVGTSEVLLRMRLTHEERAMVPFFDGVRTLDEVCALSDAPDDVPAGVAWALSVLGHLERIEQRAHDTDAAPAGAAAAVAGGAAASGAGAAPGSNGDRSRAGAGRERDREIDRARVLARYALVEEADYFQMLGIPRSASPHEVRRAHHALMLEFAPATLDPVLATELGPELRSIRTVLDEALHVLGDPSLRERYQTRLPATLPRRSAE